MKKNFQIYPKNLVAVLGLLLLMQFVIPISSFAQTPSTDINTYVLFANQHLNFKGNDNVNHPGWGFITGGNVGVNQCAGSNGNTLVFGSTVTMPDNGSEVVGDMVQIDNPSNFHTSIWQLFANSETVGFDPTVLRDPPVVAYTCPLLTTLPTCPVIPDLTGDPVVNVPASTTLTLPPGDYSDVVVNDNATLNLSDGLYRFNSFNASVSGQNITINTTDGVIVEVATVFLLNNNANVGPSNLAQFYVCGNPTNDNAMKFSQNTVFHGQVVVPNGELNLGNTTILSGRFWANYLASDFNDSVHYFPPCLPTTTPASRCDTGVVTLSAAGCSGCTTLNWYTAKTGGTAIFHGSTYSPHLTATDTFYVTCTALDGIESSPRIPVIGKIIPLPTATVTKLSCDPGNCGGSLTLTVTGGTPPLTFFWTGPNGFTSSSQNISGLCGSTITPYCVTVTTSDGCTTDLCTPVPPCSPPPCVSSPTVLRSINSYVLFAYYFLQWKGGNKAAGWGNIDGNIGVNYPLKTSISSNSLEFGTSGWAFMSNGTEAVADRVRADEGSFYDLYANSEANNFGATIRDLGPTHWATPLIATASLPVLPFTPCRASTKSAPAVSVGGTGTYPSPHTFAPGIYGNMRINDNSVVTFQAGNYDINSVSIGKNVTIIVDNATNLRIDYTFISNNHLTFGDATHTGAHIYVGACGANSSTTRTGSFSRGALIYGHYFSPTGWLDIGANTNLFGTFWAYIITGDPNNNAFCVTNSTGIREEETTDNVNDVSNDALSVYPNPFNNQTTIEFTSSKDINGTLEVFNILGMRVAEIYNGAFTANQKNTYTFDAANLAPGMYMVRLSTNEGVYTKSMIKIK